MMRIGIKLSGVSRYALLTGLLAALAPAIHADEHSMKCTNAALKGSYGFYRAGSTPDGTLAAVGIIIFDGKGNNVATQNISRNGDYSFDVTFPSTYEIDEDCTGKAFNDGSEFVRLVVTDDGKGFYMLSESNGNAVYGVGRQIHRQ